MKNAPQTILLGPMFDREPPSDKVAEAALLGAMALDNEVTADCLASGLSENWFTLEQHRAAFDAIRRAHTTGNVDLVQVFSASGGVLTAEYLAELAEGVPYSGSAPYYMRIVRRAFRLRKIAEASGAAMHAAYHAGHDSDGSEILDRIETDLFAIHECGQHHKSETTAEAMDRVLRDLEGEENGIKCGFYDLDAMTRGFRPGELIIIAGRPSMGKTAMMMGIAMGIAEYTNPVMILSMEMGIDSLLQRMIASRAGVDASRLRRNTIGPSEWEHIHHAAAEVKELPICIDDEPGLTVGRLRAKTRRAIRKHGIRAVMVDYLQLMTAPESARESRQVEVSAISRGLKALARECEIPIIALCQLNRMAESRAGNTPRMSDLRESGSLEQDADSVILLHREDYYRRGEAGYVETGIADIIVAKQRSGPTGNVQLIWDAPSVRFHNMSRNQ